MPNIKTKNKNRAKGINKSEPPRRARKADFLASIFPRPYNITTKERKAHTLHQKRQKRRFLLLCAYHRQKAEQYKCDTSVLCLYLRVYAYQWPHPLLFAHTATLSILDFCKKFFLKILALEQKSFSENFFLIFLFSFFLTAALHKFADIAHLFALQSLEMLFMYN